MRQALLGDGRQTRPRARTRTGGDAPVKFLQATIWMFLSLPHMAEIMAPLRALMEH